MHTQLRQDWSPTTITADLEMEKNLRHLILTGFLSILLLTACTRSEDEARVLLNQALTDWQAGDIVQAEEKFATIEANYLSTAVATEAIKERRSKKEAYRLANDPLQASRRNKGGFARKVIASISEYHNKHSEYPENLENIDRGQFDIHQDINGYISQCEYKKALFNYGYQLDCSAATITYNKDRAEAQRTKAIYSSKSKGNSRAHSLAEFPIAKSTWGARFNPSETMPERGINAYYFNTNSPNKLIAEETVDEVRINYSWDKFHGIKSQDFGGYWVSTIQLDRKETSQIAISQSWSKTRLIIDGYVVYEGGSDHELNLTLEPGTHRVEVEYINNWHTTEFSLVFLNQIEKLSTNDIKQRLANNIRSEYDIYYVGLYESDQKDLSVILNIDKTPRTIVLFMSSYSAIKWRISNPFGVNIRAIVYGSHSPGTTVVGELDPTTLLLPSARRIGSYHSPKNCNCSSGHFHCGGRSALLSTKKTVEMIGGAQLRGVSGRYSAGDLRVPEIIINDLYIEELEAESDQFKKLKAACDKQANPDFENMFNDN